jgi:uncharacterized protein YbaR (Trm112 family)
MKRSDISLFLCPKCRAPLNLIDAGSDSTTDDQDQIVTGGLVCSACERRYPIVRGIPRFAESKNYAASFGHQWICARRQSKAAAAATKLRGLVERQAEAY